MGLPTVLGTKHKHKGSHVVGDFTPGYGTIRWEILRKLRVEQRAGSGITGGTEVEHPVDFKPVTDLIAEPELEGILNNGRCGHAVKGQFVLYGIRAIGVSQP